MAKLTLTDLANLQNENTAVSAINANNAATETAMEKTLSRDGTSPNQMGATLDMNSHPIINLPEPQTATEPVRKEDLFDLVGSVPIVDNTDATTGAIVVFGNSVGTILQGSPDSTIDVDGNLNTPVFIANHEGTAPVGAYKIKDAGGTARTVLSVSASGLGTDLTRLRSATATGISLETNAGSPILTAKGNKEILLDTDASIQDTLNGQFWTNTGGKTHRLQRLFIGTATQTSGNAPPTTDSWLSGAYVAPHSTLTQNASLAVISPLGLNSLLTASRTSDFGGGAGCIPLMSWAFNDDPASVQGCWSGYFEARKMLTAHNGGSAHGIEIDATNLSGTTIYGMVQPYNMGGDGTGPGGSTGIVSALWLASGGEVGTADAHNAIGIRDNGQRFLRGIVFGQQALRGTDGTGTGTGEAIVTARGHGWYQYAAKDRPEAAIIMDVGIAGRGMRLWMDDTGTSLKDQAGNPYVSFGYVASPANYPSISSGTSGSGIGISAVGSDTNINVVLSPKGSGVGKVGSDTISTLTATQTFTNKTLTSPAINIPTIIGGTHTAITSLGIRSTGAAFDMTVANTEVLTAGRTLTITLNDTARTINLAGNLTLSGALTTSGAFGTTITSTATTAVTLPISGTLLSTAISAQTITSAAGTGPSLIFTNSANSRTLEIGVPNGFATSINCTGTNLQILSSGTQAAVISSSGTVIGSSGGTLGDGTVNVLTAYYTAGTKVVGARNTGWTTQTAVGAKTDLGASPTVGALASWAAAIQAALTTHGLLGT